MRQTTTKITVLLAVFALVACAGEDPSTSGEDPATTSPASQTSSDAAASDEVVKFGYLIGVTGDYAPFFEPSLAGAEIAIEAINDAGGVLGQQVELVTIDNQSSVEGAVQGFNRATNIEDVAVIGGLESDAALAILDSLAEQQIPAMCPTCGTPELDTSAGEYLWRITPSDTDLGLIAAQYAGEQGLTSGAMLVQNTEGASGVAEVFRSIYGGPVGGTINDEVLFDPGRASYQAEVRQAFQSSPDVALIASGYEAGLIILQEWQRRGYGGSLLLTTDLIVPEIAALDFLADGVATAISPGNDTTSPAYEFFATQYEERTGNQPSAGFYETNHYDQYIALALAAEVAGSLEGADVAAAVPEVLNGPGTLVHTYEEGLAAIEAGEEIDYHGATSNLDVNEYGNLESPLFSVQQISDGAWSEAETIELDASLRQQ